MHDLPCYKLSASVVDTRPTLRKDGGEHVQGGEVSVEIVHVAHHLKTDINLQYVVGKFFNFMIHHIIWLNF